MVNVTLLFSYLKLISQNRKNKTITILRCMFIIWCLFRLKSVKLHVDKAKNKNKIIVKKIVKKIGQLIVFRDLLSQQWKM